MGRRKVERDRGFAALDKDALDGAKEILRLMRGKNTKGKRRFQSLTEFITYAVKKQVRFDRRFATRIGRAPASPSHPPPDISGASRAH